MQSVELFMPFFSIICSPRCSHFLLMLSCWCTMHCVSTLLFDSPIYFSLHKQSNWYTPSWLFGGSFSLFFLSENLMYIFSRRDGNIFPYFFLSHVLFLGWCLESKVTSQHFYSLNFQCFFRDCSYYSFYWSQFCIGTTVITSRGFLGNYFMKMGNH